MFVAACVYLCFSFFFSRSLILSHISPPATHYCHFSAHFYVFFGRSVIPSRAVVFPKPNTYSSSILVVWSSPLSLPSLRCRCTCDDICPPLRLVASLACCLLVSCCSVFFCSAKFSVFFRVHPHTACHVMSCHIVPACPFIPSHFPQDNFSLGVVFGDRFFSAVFLSFTALIF